MPTTTFTFDPGDATTTSGPSTPDPPTTPAPTTTAGPSTTPGPTTTGEDSAGECALLSGDPPNQLQRTRYFGMSRRQSMRFGLSQLSPGVCALLSGFDPNYVGGSEYFNMLADAGQARDMTQDPAGGYFFFGGQNSYIWKVIRSPHSTLTYGTNFYRTVQKLTVNALQTAMLSFNPFDLNEVISPTGYEVLLVAADNGLYLVNSSDDMARTQIAMRAGLRDVTWWLNEDVIFANDFYSIYRYDFDELTEQWVESTVFSTQVPATKPRGEITCVEYCFGIRLVAAHFYYANNGQGFDGTTGIRFFSPDDGEFVLRGVSSSGTSGDDDIFVQPFAGKKIWLWGRFYNYASELRYLIAIDQSGSVPGPAFFRLETFCESDRCVFLVSPVSSNQAEIQYVIGTLEDYYSSLLVGYSCLSGYPGWDCVTTCYHFPDDPPSGLRLTRTGPAELVGIAHNSGGGVAQELVPKTGLPVVAVEVPESVNFAVSQPDAIKLWYEMVSEAAFYFSDIALDATGRVWVVVSSTAFRYGAVPGAAQPLDVEVVASGFTFNSIDFSPARVYWDRLRDPNEFPPVTPEPAVTTVSPSVLVCSSSRPWSASVVPSQSDPSLQPIGMYGNQDFFVFDPAIVTGGAREYREVVVDDGLGGTIIADKQYMFIFAGAVEARQPSDASPDLPIVTPYIGRVTPPGAPVLDRTFTDLTFQQPTIENPAADNRIQRIQFGDMHVATYVGLERPVVGVKSAGVDVDRVSYTTNLAAFRLDNHTAGVDYSIYTSPLYTVFSYGPVYDHHGQTTQLTNLHEWFVMVRLVIEATPDPVPPVDPDSVYVDSEIRLQLNGDSIDIDTAVVRVRWKYDANVRSNTMIVCLRGTPANHAANFWHVGLGSRKMPDQPAGAVVKFTATMFAIRPSVWELEAANTNNLDLSLTRPASGICPVAVIYGPRQDGASHLVGAHIVSHGGNLPVNPTHYGNADSYGGFVYGPSATDLATAYPPLFIYGNAMFDILGQRSNPSGILSVRGQSLTCPLLYLPLTGSQVIPSEPLPTTAEPGTTATPTTTTMEPDPWSDAWLYVACSDGIRGYKGEDEVAFLAHGNQCLGVCVADGPGIYWTSGGAVFWSPPDLNDKLRLYHNPEQRLTDIAFDNQRKLLVVQHRVDDLGGMPFEGLTFLVNLSGQYVGTLANAATEFRGPFGNLAVDPVRGIAYQTGNWNIARPDDVSAGTLPTYRVPALLDTNDIVDVDVTGAYFLDRHTARFVRSDDSAAPYAFAFSAMSSLVDLPNPTTADDSTTTTAEPTTTELPTTTSSVTTAAPTTTTTSTTTLDPAPPPPGDIYCWDATSQVQAYPGNSVVRITSHVSLVQEMSQLVSDLPPDERVVGAVSITVAGRPLYFALLNNAGTVLEDMTISAIGTYRLATTVPADGKVRILMRVAPHASGNYVEISGGSLRLCAADDPSFSMLSSLVSSSQPKWSGYLTTGVLKQAELSAGLASCFGGEELPDLNAEPARIVSLSGFTRKGVQIWNEKRTRVLMEDECKPIVYASELPQYVLEGEIGSGPIRFAGGYQTLVSQSQRGSQLTIRTIVGGGALGSPVDEIPMTGEDEVPDGRDYLDGGLNCNSVLRSINGVGGPDIQLSGGLGVLVGEHPDLSRVVLHVNGEAITVCPGFPLPEAVEAVPDRDETCGLANGDPPPQPGTPDLRAGFLMLTTPPPMMGFGAGPGPEASQTQMQALSGNLRVSPGGRFGGCRYRRTPSHWEIIQRELAANCECQTPRYQGYVGQELTVSGVPAPADQVTIVRNAFFVEDLQYWRIDGEGRLEVARVENIAANLPQVHLGSGAKLLQANIPLVRGRYRLQLLASIRVGILLAIVVGEQGELCRCVVPANAAPEMILSDLFVGDARAVSVQILAGHGAEAKLTQIALVPS